VVIKPLGRGEEALVGIRFYRHVSEVRLPAEKLYYVTATWDIPAKFTYDGAEYVLIASLSSKPPRLSQTPNKALDHQPGFGNRKQSVSSALAV
jgi:hypothetical protein